MTFDEILEQVITLLKRQGRVSYRALKMRLDIDDEYLDVLKEEMLFAYPVVDEEGRGLVWTGEAERPPVSTSTQPAPQEVTPAIQPTQADPPPHEPPPPEAERRQLTVMFCDLAIQPAFLPNSIPKSIGKSSVPINRLVRKSSHALMDTLHSS